MQQAIGMRSGYNIIIILLLYNIIIIILLLYNIIIILLLYNIIIIILLLLYNIISETQTVPQTILTSKFRKREKLYAFMTPFLITIDLT